MRRGGFCAVGANSAERRNRLRVAKLDGNWIPAIAAERRSMRGVVLVGGEVLGLLCQPNLRDYANVAIDRFEFADGAVLTYNQVIDLGFDLDGTMNNSSLPFLLFYSRFRKQMDQRYGLKLARMARGRPKKEKAEVVNE